MNKFSLSLILLVVLSNYKMNGQTYSFTPSKNYLAMVDTSQLNFNGIEITNTGSQNLDLTWELILKDTLIDSEFDLCNSGICFNTLPVSGVLPTLLPNETGWLKLHMFSGRTMGVNTIKYVLKNGSTQIDTLTFIIIVGNVTLANNEITNTLSNVVVYPNPANSCLNIKYTSADASPLSIKLIDVLGHIVLNEQPLSIENNNVQLNVSHLSSGVYSLLITNSKGVLSQKKIVID